MYAQNSDLMFILWLAPRAAGAIAFMTLSPRAARRINDYWLRQGGNSRTIGERRAVRCALSVACAAMAILLSIAWFVWCPIPPTIPLFI